MAESERTAVIAPGRNYGPDAPLLMFAAVAIRRRRGRTITLGWSANEGFEQLRSAVTAAAAEAIGKIGGKPLIIAKSLGSLAAPVVAEHSLPAVWFTPILNDEATVAAMRRAEGPSLLVGGTADQFWDGRIARSISARVVEIEKADHGMFVPGKMSASAEVLARICDAVEEFLDAEVWH